MLRLVSFLFALFVLVRPVLPVLDYALNYDYIVEELCVNRDRPELECNGRCYLMQALAEEASRKKEAAQQGLKSSLHLGFTFFAEPGIDYGCLQNPVDSQNPIFFGYLAFASKGYDTEVFRPPISVLFFNEEHA
ncbi:MULTISPECIES: hypothetical protein [unclassified Leeuwenhoekiella]|uniref:hypothetical protein n=1 Tax=unclassified Leeuwenhoekiella TaxID=2615029 RepID=UPI000C4CBE58|nr:MULTISPECIES: hypothetical protein [unclassified Leeuwenhoekiella]MAW96897.1 hypothetical protein [Leeuwenhoekiella sp.]MBA80601.1 hypothetical protein [Leeuwenhoekiella sp.]|tara:strand:+ start:2160 stop:2561 length:402 start_codon:yes stop_codon:yes gene_type:complete